MFISCQGKESEPDTLIEYSIFISNGKFCHPQDDGLKPNITIQRLHENPPRERIINGNYLGRVQFRVFTTVDERNKELEIKIIMKLFNNCSPKEFFQIHDFIRV